MMSVTVEPSLSEHVLREGIEQSLRAHLSDNAVFLAERLCLAHPSPSSDNFLARAHLQAGDLTRAANALHPPSTPTNRYLYALCCYKIGTPERLRDAEDHLSVLNTRAIPGGAAGLYLLAAIYHRTGRKEAAVEHYQRALRSNSTLWVAFEQLSKLGLGPSKVDAVFGNADDTTAKALLSNQPFASPPPPAPAPLQNPNSPHTPQLTHAQQSAAPLPLPSPRRRLRGLNSMARVHSAPSPREDNRFENSSQHGYVTPSPVGGPRGGMGNEYGEENQRHAVGRRVARTNHNFGASGTVSELQAKLFSTPSSADSTPRKKGPLRRTTKQSTSATSNANTELTLNVVDDTPSPSTEIKPEAMEVIRKLAKVVAACGRYQCEVAINCANALPEPHNMCALAHSLRARAHLESGRFAEATTWYTKALSADINSLTDIAARYSTALWHTKDAVSLTALAARAMRLVPVPPSAWVAAGNCASLQRDGEAALKYFRKATQEAPRCAYAQTLVGHELSAKEEFDGALRAFRLALSVDERCYPAMYGVAQVLHKQEQYLLSERHYRAALTIHPRNAFLHYHLALALAARAAADYAKSHAARGVTTSVRTTPPATDLLPALEEINKACELDPENPVAAFERAKMLAAVGRTRDARSALVKLRDTMPKEAEVHYELARLDRQLGDHAAALLSISTATAIDPKERKYKKESEALNVATASPPL